MAETQAAHADPLAGLVDLPLPEPVSLWPQTWTSRIAIVVCAVVVAVAIVQFIRSRRASRYRREALAELDGIKRRMDAGGICGERLVELSMLVRRTALTAFPRATIAPLAGSAWLDFLDRSYDGDGFSKGSGRLLSSGPYDRTPPGRPELRSLATLVRQWIRGHHA